MKFAGSWLLAFSALFAACERVEVSSTHTLDPEPTTGEPLSSFGAQPTALTLIQRMAISRQVTTFQGVRRVELFFDGSATQHHNVVREEVSADGHGAYAIRVLEVIEPQMASAHEDLFRALQSLAQGMSWRYRDFSIRDVGLFLQNYRATDTGVTGIVAGRPVIELRIERLDQSGSIYTVLVDSSTGLVLKSREESGEGVLICESSYESLDLAPDLSGVAWHQDVNNEQALPTLGPLAALIGFECTFPRTLPAGFQLLERASISHPQEGSLWVKATYTDGVECLFFIHGGPIVGGNGIKSGVPEIQADLVEVSVAAPWTIARGNLRLQRVMAMGKATEADILAMLSSAME